MLADTSDNKIYPSGPGCSKVRQGYPPDKSLSSGKVAGCKKSRCYGLPFGQVVASVYQPKSLLSSPKKFLMSSIDYSSSVIRISKNFTPGNQTRLSVHAEQRGNKIKLHCSLDIDLSSFYPSFKQRGPALFKSQE